MAAKSPSPKRGTPNGKKPAGKPPLTNKAVKPAANKKAKASAPAKKKPKGPIALRSKESRAAEPTAAEVFYIFVEGENLQISKSRPKAAARVDSAAHLDEVKEVAVDRLIQWIDDLESRLWQIKQSADIETLLNSH